MRCAWLFGMLCALVAAAPAFGCSCAGDTDPREDLDNADAAIFGEVLERRQAGDRATFRIRVIERFKGELGDEVVLTSSAYGSSCGLEVEPGEQTGLLLYRDPAGGWTSGLCSTRTREHLRAGQNPGPPSASPGPPRMLVAGPFGPERVAALDAKGRLVGLGAGAGETQTLAPCPGGRTVLEVVFRRDAGFALAVRDVATLEVRRETPLRLFDASPDGEHEGISDEQPTDARCLASNGSLAVVGVVGRREAARLIHVAGGAQRTLWRSRGQSGRLLLGERHAWVHDRFRLVRLALRTGRARDLGPRPPGEYLSGASPDGRRLVAVTSARRQFASLLDARTGRELRRRQLRYPGQTYWLGRDSVVLSLGAKLVFGDARWRPRRTVAEGYPVVASAGRLHVVRAGRLHVYDARGRQLGPARPLFTRNLQTLALLPRTATRARVSRCGAPPTDPRPRRRPVARSGPARRR